MTDLDALIRKRIGPQRYGIFYGTGEGAFYPNGDEETSGCVVAEDGRHYGYWTDWDYVAGCLIFGIWRPIDVQSDWFECEEYRDARAAAGLTAGGGRRTMIGPAATPSA